MKSSQYQDPLLVCFFFFFFTSLYADAGQMTNYWGVKSIYISLYADAGQMTNYWGVKSTTLVSKQIYNNNLQFIEQERTAIRAVIEW